MGPRDDIPDARTIWAFRERLGAEGARGLFDTFWKVMEEAGIKFSKGVAIDASFQEAPRERNSREENKRIKEEGAAPAERNKHKRAPKDMDARWANKGDETHYGYKNHVAADVKTKLIRDYRVTPASDHDISVFEDIIPEHTRDIYADSAYMSAPLTGRQKHINHVISKKRCAWSTFSGRSSSLEATPCAPSAWRAAPSGWHWSTSCTTCSASHA